MNAEKKREILDRLADLERAGRITPQDVVDDARDPDSPLHDLFEWDDGVAAEQFRLYQARKVLAIRVKITTETTTVSTVRYVRDPDAKPGEQGYRSVTSLRTQAESARAALQHEVDCVLARLRRAQDIAAGLGLEDEVDAILAQVGLLREKVLQRAA